MFGRSQLVTKGTVVLIVLLFVGTTWAEDTALDHGDLQKIVTTSTYLSGSKELSSSNDNMEEVVVSSERNSVNSFEQELLELGIEKPPRFNFEVEFLPERHSKNIADHSELVRFDDQNGRTGFIELFRVRFGGN